MVAPKIAERVLKIIGRMLGDVPKSPADEDSVDVADPGVQIETEFGYRDFPQQGRGYETFRDVIDSVKRNIGTAKMKGPPDD